MILCNNDLFILAFSWFTRFTYLKWLFRNVYLKRFPTRSLSSVFPMFYSVAYVSELYFFVSVYSQEHHLMALSDKNICNKQFDLLVFPRNLLKFGFNIAIGIPQCLYSECCSNNYFWLELLIYGNQSISMCSNVVMIYNENRLTSLHIRLLFFLVLFCFLIFENHQWKRQKRGLMFLGIDKGDRRMTSLILF